MTQTASSDPIHDQVREHTSLLISKIFQKDQENRQNR